ncbi:hypothetical protein [Streptomyces sp. NPDC000880]
MAKPAAPRPLRKFDAALLALGLVSVAFPSAIPPVLGALGVIVTAVLAVAGWVLSNLALACTIGAGVLLAYAFPGTVGRSARWIGRALVASIAAVAPKTA